MTTHRGHIAGMPDWEGPSRLTRLSWAMVPASLIVWGLVSSALFYALKGPLGLREGEVLLMARNAGGWFAETGSFLISVAAPLAGVVFGVAGFRRGGRGLSLAAVAVNTCLCLLVLYSFIDAIHMTYFPAWW